MCQYACADVCGCVCGAYMCVGHCRPACSPRVRVRVVSTYACMCKRMCAEAIAEGEGVPEALSRAAARRAQAAPDTGAARATERGVSVAVVDIPSAACAPTRSRQQAAANRAQSKMQLPSTPEQHRQMQEVQQQQMQRRMQQQIQPSAQQTVQTPDQRVAADRLEQAQRLDDMIEVRRLEARNAARHDAAVSSTAAQLDEMIASRARIRDARDAVQQALQDPDVRAAAERLDQVIVSHRQAREARDVAMQDPEVRAAAERLDATITSRRQARRPSNAPARATDAAAARREEAARREKAAKAVLQCLSSFVLEAVPTNVDGNARQTHIVKQICRICLAPSKPLKSVIVQISHQ